MLVVPLLFYRANVPCECQHQLPKSHGGLHLLSLCLLKAGEIKMNFVNHETLKVKRLIKPER